MMSQRRVDHDVILAMTLQQIGTDFWMSAFQFVISRFANIVQQTAAPVGAPDRASCQSFLPACPKETRLRPSDGARSANNWSGNANAPACR